MGLAADPKSERAKEGRAGADDLGPVWIFTVNDEVHRIYKYRISSNDIAELRAGFGKSFNEMLHMILDLDVYSAFLWLEARQNGTPRIPWSAAPVLTGADVCDVLSEDPEQSAEVGSPEG